MHFGCFSTESCLGTTSQELVGIDLVKNKLYCSNSDVIRIDNFAIDGTQLRVSITLKRNNPELT